MRRQMQKRIDPAAKQFAAGFMSLTSWYPARRVPEPFLLRKGYGRSSIPTCEGENQDLLSDECGEIHRSGAVGLLGRFTSGRRQGSA